MPSGLQEILVSNVGRNLSMLEIVKYAGLCSSTYLLLEIISTLEDEIRLIWPSRWSIMKIIYLLNRYSPLIDSTLSLSMALSTTDTHSCDVKFHILAYTHAIGSSLAESILIVRTLALYEFSCWIICIMAATALGVVGTGLYISAYVLSKTQYPSQAVLKIAQCVPSIDDSQSWVYYVCILISETLIVALTVYKMWQTSVELKQRSLLVWTMYCDGLLYYVVLLVLSTVNICLMLLAPRAATSIMQMPLRVIHSTLCTRVLLNLRKVAARLAHMTFTLDSRGVHPRSYPALTLCEGGSGDGDGYMDRYVAFRSDVEGPVDMDLRVLDIELESVDIDVSVSVDSRDPEACSGSLGGGE
ncbi:hypothetical protein GY45DRAFT_1364296 [Cubamyces sp. BRFM 1775]|nr:hypothetical protein GY45DRAFT_1364296 [Cubamyces sp. BRFM 1775]